jgi:hypothetical protein
MGTRIGSAEAAGEQAADGTGDECWDVFLAAWLSICPRGMGGQRLLGPRHARCSAWVPFNIRAARMDAVVHAPAHIPAP